APPQPQPLPPPPPPQEVFNIDHQDEPIRRHARRSNGSLSDLVTFRLMITPILIQIVFWVGTALCLFMGIRLATGSVPTIEEFSTSRTAREDDSEMRTGGSKVKQPELSSRTKFSIVPLLSGIAVMIFGPLLLRVYCELAIVFFKIHDELKELNDV